MWMSGRALDSKWIAIDPVADDNAIPSSGRSANGFDMGAGLYYRSPKLWLGLSSTQLPETELSDVSIKDKVHYYVQAGYDWAIGGNKKYTLQPSVLKKATPTPPSWMSVLCSSMTIWYGSVLAMRTKMQSPMIGYQYKFPKGDSMLRIGYSYDVTTSELKNYSSGSHEIMLSYCSRS